jgi:hypothetical protein
MFKVALELLERYRGSTEAARSFWLDVFDTAERIHHNQSLGAPTELDQAIDEQRRRFDEAIAARQKFHVVKEGD